METVKKRLIMEEQQVKCLRYQFLQHFLTMTMSYAHMVFKSKPAVLHKDLSENTQTGTAVQRVLTTYQFYALHKLP